MRAPTSLELVALFALTLAPACRAPSTTAEPRPGDRPVATWDGLELRQRDLAFAVSTRPDEEALRGDPARLDELVAALLVDEAQARQAAREIPGAAARAAAAARGRAIELLAPRGAARRDLLERLGGTSGVRLNEPAIQSVIEGANGVEDITAVASLGDLRVTAAELRALVGAEGLGPGAPDRARRFGSRLAEELVLWEAARRAGLDRRAEVVAAARSVLAAEQRERLAARAASPSADEVRTRYDRAPGDYTVPRRIRVASLVSQDRARAERWAAELRAARFPGNRFDDLLARESENLAARANGGDLGWIDGRTRHLPEAFQAAALAFARPGQVSGVLVANGAYHVLFCRDLQPERVKPFDEVEPEIRDRLTAERRRATVDDALRELRERVRPAIDRNALRTVDWSAR